MDINEFIKTIKNSLEEKLGVEITTIKISDISIMCDYFIIVSANNNSHMQALSNNVEEKVKEKYDIMPKREGRDNKEWILLDYGDVIVHIFSKEIRNFYNLERMWCDGQIIS